MTMADESDIRVTMRTQLNTVSTLPDVSVNMLYENIPFDPPDIPDGVQETSIWIEERQRILSENHTATQTLRTTGQTTYTFYTPKGAGTRDLEDLTKAVAEAFEPTNSLTGDVETIILLRTRRFPLSEREDHPGWVFKSVTIDWDVFTSTTP